MKVLKGIVFLLVLANVGYFLYARGIAVPPYTAQPAPATPGLKLVAETSAPVAPAAPSRCVSIGPFSELAESTHAQATLRGGGYAPRQRVADADIADGVLVYLPMPATPAAATALRRKLKGAGIAEAPDVSGPNDVTVISLGSFSDSLRAQARMTQIRQLGLSPQSLEHKQGGTVYWLDVDLKPSDGPLNPADLHADNGHGVQLEVRECPAPGATAASGAAVPGPATAVIAAPAPTGAPDAGTGATAGASVAR